MPKKTDKERTERATPKRRQEARERGQVARSREISSALVLFGCLVILYYLWVPTFTGMSELIKHFISNAPNVCITKLSTYNMFLWIIRYLGNLLSPFIILLFGLAIFGNLIQGGLIFTSVPLEPDFSRINPLNGFRNIFFSTRTLAELVKNSVKILITGYVGYITVKGQIERIPPLVDTEVWNILVFILSVSIKIFFNLCIVLAILAILDYGYQKWHFEESIKMTKEEVKEEYKQMEGDPQIKARIRRIQREMARRRMMAAIPKADVVITNPTHYAIALKYEKGKMHAPIVVAKGARYLAEKIK
jgi:flagellar biosynthetic protein FlhB